MKTFKKFLPILLAAGVFATNLNGMYQEPPLALQVNPSEFCWENKQHVQALKESYNNNLRMVIIIACSVRGQKLIEKDKDIESIRQKGQRILYLPGIDESGKKINATHLVEAIDPLFQSFIDQLMLLIKKMPELFTHDDLLQHQKRMGLIEGFISYLDLDPAQTRANNNLTTKESRRVSGQGQVTRDITNVNSKFKQCLANLETILGLLGNHISSQANIHYRKILAISNTKRTSLRRNSTGTTIPTHFEHCKRPESPNKEQIGIIKNLTDQVAAFYKLYATPPVTPK